MSTVLRRGGGLIAATSLLLMTVLGCGTPETSSANTATDVAGAHETAASVPPAKDSSNDLKPTSVRIPKINAESSLISVAVNLEGKISVPSVKTPMQAAWYRLSPVPGEVGPAIVLGHVDGEKKPGIFYRLKELAPGDEIDIDRSDGKKLKFVVSHRDQVPKEQFPQDAVYGNSEKPQLRLITCGGAFDHAEHSYKDNIIVYADLASP